MVDSIPPFSGQKDAEEMQFQYRGDCLNTEGSGKKLYHHKFKALNIITNETRGSVC
jgi:NADPH-dependent 7-cyano-7-deazaguanine reductase QueF